MSVVRSTATKTLNTSSDLAEFEARFQMRLEALARVQGLLSRLGEHDRVNFDELVRTELEAMGAPQDAVTIEGRSGVKLRSSTVQILAMALHELATNAVKYGALAQPGGHLSISWSVTPDQVSGLPWLCVEWRETGVAVPEAFLASQPRGQGRELIERALPYQLGARTTFTLNADGVRCTIEMPVSTQAGTDAAG
jgi:two-component sensor histidine kinase